MSLTPPGSPLPTLCLRQRAWLVLEVLRVAGKLGLTSFGGPIAHIGYFRAEYVERRGWLDDDEFAELTVLCQLLPGPASSQLGFAVGVARAGLPGGIASWVGFTLPSAVALVALALLGGGDLAGEGWVSGLKIVAVAVVAQAVWNMGRALLVDPARVVLAVAAVAIVLVWDSSLAQLAAIVAGGLLGRILIDGAATTVRARRDLGISRRAGAVALALLLVLLVALPVARRATESHAVAMMDGYARSGALVFGGGHVVLPLLEQEVVDTSWVQRDAFLAGYGATQAVPGPLFTFAAYLGAVQGREPSGVAGAAIAVVSLFAPGLLLVVGALPLWGRSGTSSRARASLAGVNAVVVGVLAAALYDPVFTTAITGATQLAIGLAALVALIVARVPPWIVVAACAATGWVVL